MNTDKYKVGNSNSIFRTLGASNHTDKDRQNEDFYATDPIAAELLLKEESSLTIYGNAPVGRSICQAYSRNTGIMSAVPTW